MLADAQAGDFVYFDPPYVPLSSTAYFTAYTKGDFGPEDQGHLAWVYRELAERGCQVMLSNSDTPLVRELYRRFAIHDVQARRSINSRSDRRGPGRRGGGAELRSGHGRLALPLGHAPAAIGRRRRKSGNRGTRASR